MKLIQEMSISGFRLLSRILTFLSTGGHAQGTALLWELFFYAVATIELVKRKVFNWRKTRTNMVIPTPILELIRFRVSQRHKYRAILGAEMYSIEAAVDAGLMMRLLIRKI